MVQSLNLYPNPNPIQPQMHGSYGWINTVPSNLLLHLQHLSNQWSLHFRGLSLPSDGKVYRQGCTTVRFTTHIVTFNLLKCFNDGFANGCLDCQTHAKGVTISGISYQLATSQVDPTRRLTAILLRCQQGDHSLCSTCDSHTNRCCLIKWPIPSLSHQAHCVYTDLPNRTTCWFWCYPWC